MYWTGATVSTFGGLPLVVAVLVAGLLALYMAAYIAVFGAITAILVRRFGVAGLWLAPAAWVALEYLRGILFGGFPWIPARQHDGDAAADRAAGERRRRLRPVVVRGAAQYRLCAGGDLERAAPHDRRRVDARR